MIGLASATAQRNVVALQFALNLAVEVFTNPVMDIVGVHPSYASQPSVA